MGVEDGSFHVGSTYAADVEGYVDSAATPSLAPRNSSNVGGRELIKVLDELKSQLESTSSQLRSSMLTGGSAGAGGELHQRGNGYGLPSVQEEQ